MSVQLKYKQIFKYTCQLAGSHFIIKYMNRPYIFCGEMKPSHLAGLFEYLFMFWLYRHLPTKQDLNSKLTAKWLGFISLSNIWTDHIFIFSSYLVLKWQVVHQKYRPNVMWQCAILLDYLIRLITSNNVIIDND